MKSYQSKLRMVEMTAFEGKKWGLKSACLCRETLITARTQILFISVIFES